MNIQYWNSHDPEHPLIWTSEFIENLATNLWLEKIEGRAIAQAAAILKSVARMPEP